VSGASIESIALVPVSPSLPFGTSATLSAIASLNDGATFDVSSRVIWSSSNPAVASVSNSPGSQGSVSALAPGSTTISVVEPNSGVTQSEVLRVTGAVLSNITVAPASALDPLGTTRQLIATGIYSDGSTVDLTQSATWASSAGAITVSNPPGASGLVTALAPGSATISATDAASGISGQTTLTVSAAILQSLSVTPPNASFPAGTNSAFRASGAYSDGSTLDLTNTVTWSSSTAVASVSNAPGSSGLTTGLSVGNATIIATDPSTQIAGTASANVTAPIPTSLQITPQSLQMSLRDVQALTATLSFSDGSSADATTSVSWSSTANVSVTAGAVSAVTTGTATVTATDPGSGLVATASVTISVGKPTSIVAGAFHTCALLDSGLVECWGNNQNGELGDGTTNDSSTPVLVKNLTNVFAIVAGAYHTCALRGGSVYCWGHNQYGQLGSVPSTTAPYAMPVPTPVANLAGVTSLGAGAFHTCAVLINGNVVCWGFGGNGELGNGDTASSGTPVPVSGLTFVTGIVAGGEATSGGHTCALLAGRTISCWGYNGFGELGDGSTTNRSTPRPVSNLSQLPAATIAAHSDITCATFYDGGSERCWGNGGFYALGNGSTVNSSVPVSPALPKGAIMTPGTLHGCARLLDGTVSCWGYNGQGELGNGSFDDAPVPVPVSDLVGSFVQKLTAGDNHTCALVQDDNNPIQCWGYNHSGELGDGTTQTSPVPVMVVAGSGSLSSPLPCPPSLALCDGTCIDPQTDAENCGACGNSCDSTNGALITSCGAGHCVSSCAPGFTACNGACVNALNDPNNCGSCGTTCPSSEICQSSSCQ
jgi:alpha-tubulin suppressor-like RCC1 family protein